MHNVFQRIDPSRPLEELLATSAKDLLELYSTHSNLTQSQLFFWVTQKIQPEIPLYNVANLFIIDGRIDIELFQKAFQMLVQASDSLRIAFGEEKGIPQQYILPSLSYIMQVIDVSHSPDPLKEVEHLAYKRVHQPFDLSKRLFDSVLFKVSQDNFIWYHCDHHIISDAWSRTVLCHRMIELYDMLLQNKQPDIHVYPQFYEYIQHDRIYRSSKEYLKEKAYWDNKLSERIDSGPFQRNTSYGKAHTTQALSYQLTQKHMDAIHALSVDKNVSSLPVEVTLFALYVSLVFIYLYSLTGPGHFSIATNFQHRFSQRYKETMGLLYKESILRITLEDSDTMRTVISKTIAEVVEVLTNYRYSVFNYPPQSHHNVFFLLQNSSFQPCIGFGGASVSTQFIPVNYSYESMYIQVENFSQSETPQVHFEYCEDLFSREQQQCMSQDFMKMLDVYLNDIDLPIASSRPY